MEHYLGVPVKKGLFVCPSFIRNDHKPTCAFYKKNNILFFKDFAGISGDCIDIVKHIFNCDYSYALQIIANDFGIIEGPMPVNPPKIAYSGNIFRESVPSTISVKAREYSDEDLSWWNSYGITIDILNRYNVRCVKSFYLNGKRFVPEHPAYGYYGGKYGGRELWRIYIPEEHKFLSNWSSFHIQGMRQLKKSDILIITKSLKDVMVLDSMGICSIAPNSENILIEKSRFDKLKLSYRNIYCFFDNDLPGVRGAKKYKRKYGIRCIFIKRKYAKDISDLVKAFPEKRSEIVSRLISVLQDNRNTEFFYIF